MLAHRTDYFLALFSLVLIGLLTILLPYLVGQVIDDLTLIRIDEKRLYQYALLLLSISVAMYGLRYYWRRKLFGTSYRLSIGLRHHLYQRLSRLGPAFFQRHRTGDLMARATNDVDAVELAAGEAILASFDGSLTLVMVVGMMIFGIDWRLALIALLPLPIVALAFQRIGNRLEENYTNALDRFSNLNEHTQETLAGLRPMRALGLKDHLRKSFAEMTEQAMEANLRTQKSEALFDPTILLSLGTTTLLALGLGSYLILQNELTLGQMTSFTLYLTHLIWPMFAFGWFFSLYSRALAAHTRLHVLLAEPDSLLDQGQTKMPHVHDIHVRIDDFRYPDSDQSVLSDIKLDIPDGMVLGIVGPTGCGKSTLLHLLQRYYDLEHGAITLAGHDLKDYPLSVLRDIYAMVPQDPILFSDSLSANISLGRPEASADEIDRMVSLAELQSDIVRLPQGLRTQVGEKGVTLSGGQRQRVALARALLRDAPVLCLDDTLSAVDGETEKRILNSLAQEHGNRTLLVISHRLSAVKEADQIIVLSSGRIIEQGSHEALMQHGGWYAQMYRHQQLEHELE